jgi:tight adherence protein B
LSAAPAYLLAAAAGGLCAPAVVLSLGCTVPLAKSALDRLVVRASGLVDAALAPVRRAGSHGRDPSAPERMRMRWGGMLAGGCAGWAGAGWRGALVGGLAGTFAAPRVATARRLRYGRRVEAGAGAAAIAIAGALAGGSSVRSAVGAAAGELEGPVSIELGRVAVQLEAGASIDLALDGLVSRAPSRSISLIAAAIQMQRRSGGDLAALLRRIASSLEDERRAAEEAAAATAQARATSVLVVALPPMGLVLAELASPGLVGRMIGSPLGASLVMAAVVLQVVGALAVRRLARVES